MGWGGAGSGGTARCWGEVGNSACAGSCRERPRAGPCRALCPRVTYQTRARARWRATDAAAEQSSGAPRSLGAAGGPGEPGRRAVRLQRRGNHQPRGASRLPQPGPRRTGIKRKEGRPLPLGHGGHAVLLFERQPRARERKALAAAAAGRRARGRRPLVSGPPRLQTRAAAPTTAAAAAVARQETQPGLRTRRCHLAAPAAPAASARPATPPPRTHIVAV
jgi:hypothetical protein